MNVQKLTQKSIEAVQAAQQYAVEHGQSEVRQAHLLHGLLIEQDGYAVGIDRLNYIEYALDDQRRKAERRLIHHDQLWFTHQSTGNGKHLLFAARKVVGVTVKQVGQLAEGNDLCKPLGFAFGFW